MVYEITLYGIEGKMNERILIGISSTMRNNNEATQGCYLGEWISEPYTVQENTVMKGFDPPHTDFTRKNYL